MIQSADFSGQSDRKVMLTEILDEIQDGKVIVSPMPDPASLAFRLRRRLEAVREDARRTHEADRDDFSAGRYDGLKEALAILDALDERKEV
jgi:hypothetical protein